MIFFSIIIISLALILATSDAFFVSNLNDYSGASCLYATCNYDHNNAGYSQTTIGRRALFLASLITALPASRACAKESDTSLVGKTFLRGKVTTKGDATFPQNISSSALYITARPNKADNVPRAILDGSNGKPPPILIARYPNPQFPFDFSLSTADLTQEGMLASTTNSFWFEEQDLIVSARWDTDGSASTRDPTDLVGRSLYSASKSKDDFYVQLEGRGMTGKFLTAKPKR